jgi:alanine racemase
VIDLQDLLAATAGQLLGPARVTRFGEFAFDTRTLSATTADGPLFLAVKTDTGDGHDYIAEAVRRGATGVLCEHPPVPAVDVTCIVVADTRQALTDWAAFALRQRQVEVVAVTGSSGKTSTKELIASVLAAGPGVTDSSQADEHVFRNPGSYNGRYGLAIALGRLMPTHRTAVLELAADSFGEIAELAALTRPRVGVVTAVLESHLDVFGTLDEVAHEKSMLLAALPPDGLAVLNADDPLVRAMASQSPAPALTVGFAREADLRAHVLNWNPDARAVLVHFSRRARQILPGPLPKSVIVQPALLGKHQVMHALAALAVGLFYGFPAADIAHALASCQPLPGRLRRLPGQAGVTLLDDTANANPGSMLAALETLAMFPRPHWAVLGDMEDLGEREVEGHRRVGAAAAGLEQLIAIGDRARHLAQAAREAGLARERIFHTYSQREALRFIQDQRAAPSGPAPAILIKGGRAARLEQLVENLLAPDAAAPASELLVRQDAGWRQVRLARPDRPTWLEVDLEAIAGNVRGLQEIVGPGVGLMAVLKADGYGHGAARVARTALNNGARMLAVACLAEAVTLRHAGIDGPILILGYTPPWQARDLLLNQVTPTVFDLDVAGALSRAVAALRPASGTVPVHVKVDTGMARLGLAPYEVLPFVERLASLPGIDMEGIFTHFSTAENPDQTYARWQLDQFSQVLSQLTRAGLRPRLVHAANSAATLTLPASHFNLVRVGIALYGLAPGPEVPLPAGLRPAVQWKTQVAQVRCLPPGAFVGYGNTYRTERAQSIATIPVGYADGFRRAPLHWPYVLVRGQRVPIVGRVSMDQTMLDVTEVPGVRQGDEVVLIGRQGDAEITVDQVAAALGTINYEVVSEILARVPRVV